MISPLVGDLCIKPIVILYMSAVSERVRVGGVATDKLTYPI